MKSIWEYLLRTRTDFCIARCLFPPASRKVLRIWARLLSFPSFVWSAIPLRHLRKGNRLSGRPLRCTMRTADCLYKEGNARTGIPFFVESCVHGAGVPQCTGRRYMLVTARRSRPGAFPCGPAGPSGHCGASWLRNSGTSVSVRKDNRRGICTLPH